MEEVHNIAAILRAPVHVGAYVEVFASLAALVDAYGLEVP